MVACSALAKATNHATRTIIPQLKVINDSGGINHAKEQVLLHSESMSKMGFIVDRVFNEVVFVETFLCFF